MVMLTLAYVTHSHHAFHDKKPDEEEEGEKEVEEEEATSRGGVAASRRGERGVSVVSRRLELSNNT